MMLGALVQCQTCLTTRGYPVSSTTPRRESLKDTAWPGLSSELPHPWHGPGAEEMRLERERRMNPTCRQKESREMQIQAAFLMAFQFWSLPRPLVSVSHSYPYKRARPFASASSIPAPADSYQQREHLVTANILLGWQGDPCQTPWRGENQTVSSLRRGVVVPVSLEVMMKNDVWFFAVDGWEFTHLYPPPPPPGIVILGKQLWWLWEQLPRDFKRNPFDEP